MKPDHIFLRAIGVEPCDIREPIPSSWLRSIATAVEDPPPVPEQEPNLPPAADPAKAWSLSSLVGSAWRMFIDDMKAWL